MNIPDEQVASLRVAVVTPVFNDWQCIPFLAEALGALESHVERLSLVIVNDGSSNPCHLTASDFPGSISTIEVLHLGCNLGHQRAIAIGMVEVVRRDEVDAVIVIDSDGEDAPSDALQLLNLLVQYPGSAIVAQRRNRSESLKFRLSYGIYKYLFRLLTGKSLDFGNFCAMGLAAAKRMAFMPELWNHFSATIMKSRIPVIKLPVDRRHRWLGHSQMNFVSLVNHGLGAIATFSDVVFARLLLVSALVILLLSILGVSIVFVRFTTSFAIPGWTTTAVGLTLVGLLQVLAMFAVVTFLGLSSRSSLSYPPIEVAPGYIDSIQRIR
jgi:polyisoprenyl-phosphate glycosyltransferase